MKNSSFLMGRSCDSFSNFCCFCVEKGNRAEDGYWQQILVGTEKWVCATDDDTSKLTISNGGGGFICEKHRSITAATVSVPQEKEAGGKLDNVPLARAAVFFVRFFRQTVHDDLALSRGKLPAQRSCV